jgi:hypothetical protein
MSTVPDAFAAIAEWTFHRGHDESRIRREETAQRFQLVVTASGHSRTCTFSDRERLIVFQQDMEAFLVPTGWALMGVRPGSARQTGIGASFRVSATTADGGGPMCSRDDGGINSA